MLRMVFLLGLILMAAAWLAACSSGASDYRDVRFSYAGESPAQRPAEYSVASCPEAMPTNSSGGSPHEVAGPLFCDF